MADKFLQQYNRIKKISSYNQKLHFQTKKRSLRNIFDFANVAFMIGIGAVNNKF